MRSPGAQRAVWALASCVLVALSPGWVESIPDSDPPFDVVEELVIGLDEDPPLGRIQDVDIGADGSIYVLDTGYQVVRHYSPEGEHLADLGREGEGPGEFYNPLCLAVDADGLIAVAGNSTWITLMNPDGTPLNSIQHRASNHVGSMDFDAAGRLYVTSFDRETGAVIHVYDTKTFKKLRSFGRLAEEGTGEGQGLEQSLDLETTLAAGPLAIDAGGRVLYSPVAPQRIDVYDMDGNLQSRNTARTADALLPRIKTTDSGVSVEFRSACFALLPLSGGRYLISLSVSTGNTQPGGKGWNRYLDLYDSEHRPIRTWSRLGRLGLAAVDAEDRLYTAESREITPGEDVPVLVRYRFTPPHGDN